MVICGLHRSGTTFIGKILQQSGVRVVHEPLNEQFGMKDVPIAYPYVEHNDLVPLLYDAVHMNRAWNKSVKYLHERGMRRYLFSITGGRRGLSWGYMRAQKVFGLPLGKICLKDPFMSLATPCLTKELGLPVVCMVRHPAAIHYSTNKQHWFFEIDNLMRQTDLVEKYGDDIPQAHWALAKNHAAGSIALLWKFMIRVNMSIVDEQNMLMVKHEDLCVNPLEVTQVICDHLGVNFTAAVVRYVVDHSQGKSSESTSGQVNNFKRDSKSLVNVWKGKLPASDESLIFDLVGEDLYAFYPESH